VSGGTFFGVIGEGNAVAPANPSRVVRGDRVTYLLYEVQREDRG
jgi:hypothetical protein